MARLVLGWGVVATGLALALGWSPVAAAQDEEDGEHDGGEGEGEDGGPGTSLPSLRPAAAAAAIEDGAGDEGAEEGTDDGDEAPENDGDSPAHGGQRTAEAPALVVMGGSELEIARPSTPSALAATLLSSFSDGGYLPDGLAVEVTPFWLFPHPKLTLDRYYWGASGPARLRQLSRKRAKLAAEAGRDQIRARVGDDGASPFTGGGPPLFPLHELAISVALSSEDTGEDATTQSLGLGLRMPLRAGIPADRREDVRDCLNDLQQLQRYRAEWLDGWLWKHVSELKVELDGDASEDLREAVERAQKTLPWSIGAEGGAPPGDEEASLAQEIAAQPGFETPEARRDKADFWILAFARLWLERHGDPGLDVDRELAEASRAAADALQALIEGSRDAFDDDYEADKGRSYEDDRADWQDDCEDTLEVRKGFALDLAGGLSLAFGDWKIGRAHADAYGAWITPAYLDDEFSSVWMLGQFGRDLNTHYPQFSIDAGWRGVYSWHRLAVSPEIMGRFVVFDPDPSVQLRWALGIDLRVLDGVWVSASIGMDGELPYTRDLPLLSMIQLEFDTGTDRVLAPDTSEMTWLTPVAEPDGADEGESP